MFFLIIAIVLGLVGVGLFLAGKVEGSFQNYNVRPWGVAVLILALVVSIPAFFRQVGVGEVGIPVTFGEAGAPVGNGVHAVNPFASMVTISTRQETFTMSGNQEVTDKADPEVGVKGSDGGQGAADGTLTYHVEEAQAAHLYETVGTDYVDKIIRPAARSCIRDAFATATMADAATSKRTAVEGTAGECIGGRLSEHGIVVDSFQLRDVRVSPEVQTSIDQKVVAEQDVARRNLELQSEVIEAEKRRIEAKGIADSEQIIRCGADIEVVANDDGTTTEVATPKEGDACENNLTAEYLTYQHIKALEAMAENGNATVVVPTDSNLTPILPITPPSGG